jgi:hypothetical protein
MANKNRTETEVHEILEKFERKNQTFRMSVKGVSVWRILRAPIGLALQNLLLNQKPLSRYELFKAFFYSLRDLIRPVKKFHFAVKSYVSALRVSNNGRYEDIYFERLLEKIPGGIRLFSLNDTNYSSRKHSAIVPSIDCTAILILGNLLARIFPVREGDIVFAKLSSLISNNLELNNFSQRHIRRMFSSFWWQSRMYKLLLRRLGVKTVFSADTGERALLNASQSELIRFIEFQHGIFTENHPDSIAVSLLYNVKNINLLLPDMIALYGDYWVACQSRTILASLDRLFPIGNDLIEKFRAERAVKFIPNRNCPRLILTSQGIAQNTLIDFLTQFLNLYTGNCILIVKLHPYYDRSPDAYKKALGEDSRIKIISGDQDPNTYELIAQSDLHLSIASACHYDALGIGTPTAIIGIEGCELVHNLLKTGDAIYAGNPKDLAEIISKRNWKSISKSTSEKYYRSNFFKNLLFLLEGAKKIHSKKENL